MFIKKKRPLTLLEVLIAFLLVVVAVVPLIAPYRFMLVETDKRLKELEIDRITPILYSDILARILRKEITIGQLSEDTLHPITNPKGTYQYVETPQGWFVIFNFGENLVYEYALPKVSP